MLVFLLTGRVCVRCQMSRPMTAASELSCAIYADVLPVYHLKCAV